MRISDEEGDRNVPKSTFIRTGINSEKLPAGNKYRIDFRRFSKQSRPYSIPVTIAEKLDSRIKSAAS